MGDKVSRMQTDLEEESVELEAATKRERAAKDKKTEEEHKQAELRKQVADVKARADAVSAQIEQRKKESDKLNEQGTKAQAEAQAKQAASEEAIKQINQEIFETQEDTKNRKANIAKAKAKKFTQERDLHALKKQVSVLKAFLTGPMLTPA